jgi:hypothetical protein
MGKENTAGLLSGLVFVTAVFIISCAQQTENHEEPIVSYYNYDTTIYRFVNFPEFQFYIKKVTCSTCNPWYFTSVHLNQVDKSFYLFKILGDYYDKSLEYLYEDYYAYPYWTGGNYSRASGINIIKITSDTAKFLGPVCGYDDIDNNGSKELYIDDVTDMSTGVKAAYTYERTEVFIKNDTLVYQGIDLY